MRYVVQHTWNEKKINMLDEIIQRESTKKHGKNNYKLT